jgi:hypothetical protein
VGLAIPYALAANACFPPNSAVDRYLSLVTLSTWLFFRDLNDESYSESKVGRLIIFNNRSNSRFSTTPLSIKDANKTLGNAKTANRLSGLEG